MGIQDRDYMKRPARDEGQRSGPPGEGVEEFFSRFLRKHPRFFLYVGIALALLIVIALIVAQFS